MSLSCVPSRYLCRYCRSADPLPTPAPPQLQRTPTSESVATKRKTQGTALSIPLMAMASSVSSVVVCSSSFFVKGTAVSSSSLRLSPSVAAFGISNGGGSRITAMATKKVTARPKFSGKKSWLPGVKSGGNLVDPEWLDGSYVTTYTCVSRVQACWISASCDFF